MTRSDALIVGADRAGCNIHPQSGLVKRSANDNFRRDQANFASLLAILAPRTSGRFWLNTQLHNR